MLHLYHLHCFEIQQKLGMNEIIFSFAFFNTIVVYIETAMKKGALLI